MMLLISQNKCWSNFARIKKYAPDNIKGAVVIVRIYTNE